MIQLERQAQIIWFRSKFDTPVFELRIEQRRVLATEHPGTISAGLLAAAVGSVEFSNVESEQRLDYRAQMPFLESDARALSSITRGSPELDALLMIMWSMYSYSNHLFRTTEECEVPAVLYHFHAACVLLPAPLVVNRPRQPVPADWAQWLGDRLEHMYFPRLTAEERAKVGALSPTSFEHIDLMDILEHPRTIQ